MEQELVKINKDLRFLKCYAVITTSLLVLVGIMSFSGARATHFKEIFAERINIVESDGQVRMVISNKKLSPEVLLYGKPYTPPIPGGNRPGLIFYNDEGTENGGLVFRGGKDSSGKYQATGHLSFDQYNQNQVLYLSYIDENGDQSTGLHIDDWQKNPTFKDFRMEYKRIQNLPDGAEKEAMMKKITMPKPNQKFTAQRVFVGKDDSKSAMVILADRIGKPRLQMLVDSNGTARINFLDQQGKVTYSLPN